MTELALLSTHSAARAATAELHVLFKVGESEYALSAEEVLQMESYSGATHVPGAPAFVAGIMPIRGKVVPVIDLRARFGLPPQEPTLDSRVLVGQYGERTVALLADSAREVMKLAGDELKRPPELLDEAGTGFVKAIAHKGKRMILVLDFAKIIGEEAIDVG